MIPESQAIAAVILVAAAFLAFGYLIYASLKRDLEKEWRRRQDDAAMYARWIVQAEQRAVMEQAARYKAERECNRYRTAFRGEMTRQAHAELIRPDEQVGEAKVLTFTAATRGGRRVR